jgi:hypothetical protein
MKFFSTIFLAAFTLATLASGANTVTFVNQDSTQRTIIFTPNEGLESISSLVIPGYESQVATFPTAWVGNFYSVSKGAPITPGMLGEVSFNGFDGATYFDVSAIVDPNDNEGVKELFPKNLNIPLSGCQTFPCSNAYNKPNDIATLSTDESDLVCLIGNLSSERKRGLVSRMSHEYVTGAL